MFEKIHVFVKDYNRTKYLVLFGHKINGIVFDRLRYLIRGCVTQFDAFDYVKMEIDFR